jgi:diguanylate cyclase (GGDEF)-like protein
MVGSSSRLRTLPFLLVVPLFGLTVALGAWTGWFVQRERAEVAEAARRATGGPVAGEAFGALVGELQFLLALQGTGQEVPPVLRTLVPAADALRAQMTRSELVDALVVADQGAEALLPRFDGTDLGDDPAVAATFAALGQADLGNLRLEGGRISVPIRSYADAYGLLQHRSGEARRESDLAAAELAALTDRPPTWRQGSFLGLAAALLAAGAMWTFWAHRRIAGGLGVATAIDRRNSRLLALLDAARTVGAASGEAAVGAALAEEAQGLVAADFALVLVADGPDVRPLAAVGAPQLDLAALGQGAIGRAIDTGSPARVVVAHEPGLGPEPGPLGLLVTPLVADRRVIGAVVGGSRAGRLFDEEDEHAFRLLALSGATDVASARLHDSTTALVMRDALTGLANRRRLDADLASLRPEPVAFFMIDVDHFKAYNDAHGHPAGDMLLRQVGETIAGAVRDGDVTYRFGGEEFSVLLRGATPEEAAAVAERVRAAVEGRTFAGEATQPDGRLTASVGIAWRHDADSAALLAAADGALYEAKRSGRNRVVPAGATG